MADFPTAAVTRLAGYNGARYFPDSNPLGLGIGGHRQNYPQSLNDSASLAAYIAATAQEVKDHAQAVVDNLALTVEARDLARRWASDPEDQQVLAGLFSALHYARKAAASATAAATFDPALFSRLAGATFTGLVSFFVGTAARAGINLGQRGTAPTGPANGDLWSLATGLWGYFGGVARQFYDTTTLPAPTNAEIDAGTNTLRKAWSVLDVWRAARAALPLFTQAQAEAGAVTTAGAWSPQRDAQAIAAIAPKGFAFEGFPGQATITAGSGFNARGPISFVASGASVHGVASTGVDGATATIFRSRIRLFRGATQLYSSAEANMSHVGGILDRAVTPYAFAGLTKGLSYDLYLDVACDSANVITYPLISGISA